MEPTTHRCPIGDCPARVPHEQLMCPRHWRLVPPSLKRALYRAWQRGAGAGSREHQQAIARLHRGGARRLPARLGPEPAADGPHVPRRLPPPQRDQRRELGRGRRLQSDPRDALPPAQARPANTTLPALRRTVSA